LASSEERICSRWPQGFPPAARASCGVRAMQSCRKLPRRSWERIWMRTAN